MAPTASMMSMAARPQARNEPGQRGAAAGPAQDDAFRGVLRKALPKARPTVPDQVDGADPAPAADQAPVPAPAQLAVQALLAGQAQVAVPAAGAEPAQVAVPTQIVIPAPAAGETAAPAGSGQAPQPVPAPLTAEAALAMLKQLLAEHGMTELPAAIQVPLPQPEVDDKAVPAGVEALVAALIQVLPTAVPPVAAPVATDGNPGSSGITVAAPAAEASVQLERFVRQVAAALMSEAQPAEGKIPSGQPTFQDLVSLIAGADTQQAPQQPQVPTEATNTAQPLTTVQAQPKAQTQADTQGQTQHQTQPQTQTQPQLQTQPQPLGEAELRQFVPTASIKPKSPAPAESPTPASPVPQLQTTAAIEQTAAPAPPDARPPIDPEQVVRQAARFVKVALEGQRSEVRFQMHPEHLGPIAVKLILTEGQVKASMTAADPAVKAVLEANLEQLRTRLADQGFRVEQIQVTLGGGNPTGQSHQSPNDGQQQSRQPGQPRSQGQQASPESPTEQSQPRTTPTWLPGRKGSRIDSLA